MKRIVIDARESGTSTGRYVDKLCEYLEALHPSYEIILLAKSHRVSYLEKLCPSFKIIETKYKEFSFGEQIGFAWQIYRLHADLVHFPLVQHPILYFKKSVIGILDLTTLRFKNPSKQPLVFWIKQKIYWLVCWLATKKAAHIITISDFVKGDILKHFKINADKITVTHNAADQITDTASPLASLIGKKFIMYVGRPQPHKNLERLIDAYSLLLDNHPDLYLVLAGKKDVLMEALEQYAHSKGLSNVLVTGFVTDGELRWLYQNTVCYVFPSLSEGFGLPGLEAMMHGAAVASSNATSLPEINGDAADYFDPFDTEAMASVINDVISNKTHADLLRKKGLVQVKKFGWKHMAKQTISVYDDILR
jgi:glycosyltransferase involved in cell wall biosynthesis